jgi:hypothetical protein
LLSTLEPREVIGLLGLPAHLIRDPQAVALAYATLYDQRGGTVEVEIKESKQGIGINKRSKQRFAAQQMVMLLGSLAHNIIVWSRRWLTAEAPRLAGYGALRMVRDLFQVAGLLGFDPEGRLTLSLPKTSSGLEILAVREMISHSALSSGSSLFRWFASHLWPSSQLSFGSSGV